MKSLFKIFIYISVFFLLLTLFKGDYLKIPKIISIRKLSVSLFFLFLGLLTQGLSWQKILKKSQYPIKYIHSVSSIGLSIFGKYIPGKVWTIVGRAKYIEEKYGYDLKKLTIISLNEQFLALWVGLLVGSIGLFFYNGFQIWRWIIIISWTCLTIVLFTRYFHDLFKKIISIVLKKNIEIPKLSFYSTLQLIPWVCLIWLFWSTGFYFLIKSISYIQISLIIGLSFPLATSLGIMAIFFPGGIGVREGILIGTLNLAGLSIVESTSIAVASRLWFLIGESFFFIVGIISSKYPGKKL